MIRKAEFKFLDYWTTKWGRGGAGTWRRLGRRPRTLHRGTLDRRELLAASLGASAATAITDPTTASAATLGSAVAGSAAMPAVSSDCFAVVRKTSITVTASGAIHGTFEGETYSGVPNQWIVKLSDTQKIFARPGLAPASARVNVFRWLRQSPSRTRRRSCESF